MFVAITSQGTLYIKKGQFSLIIQTNLKSSTQFQQIPVVKQYNEAQLK